jgi:hypothetical protein
MALSQILFDKEYSLGGDQTERPLHLGLNRELSQVIFCDTKLLLSTERNT